MVQMMFTKYVVSVDGESLRKPTKREQELCSFCKSTLASDGGQKTERLRVVACEQPVNNDLLLVSRVSVTGARGNAE